MTTQNSILLIVKQTPGISYNSLLSKIAVKYSSQNSARAALSRALKDLSAVNKIVVDQKKNIFITDKGTASINHEMKNKLIMKLNTTVTSKSNLLHVDSIAKQMHTLLERAKYDTNLLDSAKRTANFYIKDIEELNEKIKHKIHNLEYLSKTISSQANLLKEYDFRDFNRLHRNDETIAYIISSLKETHEENIRVEIKSEDLQKVLVEKLGMKPKEEIIINLDKLIEILNLLKEIELSISTDSTILNIYSNSLLIRITTFSILITGPFSIVSKFQEEIKEKKFKFM